MSPPATLLIWFQLRSPELAEDFERLMAEDRDIVRGSLDAISDWRLTRPADVPGQAIGQADYVLIAEILEVERLEQQTPLKTMPAGTDDLERQVTTPVLASTARLCSPGGSRCAPDHSGAADHPHPRRGRAAGDLLRAVL